jgi:hypothetical protein
LEDDKRDELLGWIEQQALTAMKDAISRDETARKMLRQLMGIDPRPGRAGG